MGTAYIIDPDRDLIALYYTNMFNAEPLYPRFLEQAYRLFDTSNGATAGKTQKSKATETNVENDGTTNHVSETD